MADEEFYDMENNDGNEIKLNEDGNGNDDNPNGNNNGGGGNNNGILDANNVVGRNAGDNTNVELVFQCRLPNFWSKNPQLWFSKVEASFNLHRIRKDESKYDLIIGVLDPDIVQEVSDIVLNPPAQNKYQYLKNAILSRLTDSSDRQLHKLLTEVELGDRKPSQLLRHMKSLAGSAITEEALRVKWLDLLPQIVSRLLKVLKTSNLEEQAVLADELIEGSPTVAATSVNRMQQTPTGTTGKPTIESLAQEIAALRLSMAQLTSITRQNGQASSNQQRQQQRRRSDSRNNSRRGSRASTPVNGIGLCWFHRNYGAQARKCKAPCSFKNSIQGNN